MPSVEVCNGVDDDCDGESDETHPDLGGICETGVGLCRRSGVFVCSQDPGAPVECDAVAGEAAAIDTCNYQDDDCDGSSDEDFVDAAGLYGTVEHCGACGSNCNSLWAPTPEAFGVRTTCNAAGGVAQCGFECLAGFFDADGLSGNGCEFRPDADAVYTTTPENGGLDGPDCGGFEQPCATISRALRGRRS